MGKFSSRMTVFTNQLKELEGVVPINGRKLCKK